MYLQFLFNLSYFFMAATLIFLFCTLKWKMLVRYWKIAKIKGQNKKDKFDFIKAQEKKGLKPFEFDNGKTIIYAKNGNIALADYKKMNHRSRQAFRTLKKAK
ncbi:hypothetical protein [Flavobacterium mesophilum]|uniref:hypothetical protein n=1 Tax=Flavobacterium mesophilum TaxID=3143495 RepID=UPI0031D187CE